MTASQLLLLLVWAYFPLGLVIAAVTRTIPARGGPAGQVGFAHMAQRDDDRPSAFWVTVALHVFITLGVPIIMWFKMGGGN